MKYELVLLTGAIIFSFFVFLFFLKKRRNSSQIETIDTSQGIVKDSPLAPVEATPATVESVASLNDSAPYEKSAGFLRKSFSSLSQLFGANNEAHEIFWEKLEELFLNADFGIDFTVRALEFMRSNYKGTSVPTYVEMKALFHRYMIQNGIKKEITLHGGQLHTIMIVGVNGAGKTTTIGKLIHYFTTKQEKKVFVGAADTFRAAAVDQLKYWALKAGAEGVFPREGADPGAVAFDAIKAAEARGCDICLIDTAGRLHTKSNLMEELNKVKRVMGKGLSGAPHDIWLVLDGTMGQNAIVQAREFHKVLGLTGIIVTKLDGSAKGGALCSILTELRVPVIFIGLGEKDADLKDFSVEEYLQGLFPASLV